MIEDKNINNNTHTNTVLIKNLNNMIDTYNNEIEKCKNKIKLIIDTDKNTMVYTNIKHNDNSISPAPQDDFCGVRWD